MLPKIVDFSTQAFVLTVIQQMIQRQKIKIKITTISVQIENKISTKKPYIQEESATVVIWTCSLCFSFGWMRTKGED